MIVNQGDLLSDFQVLEFPYTKKDIFLNQEVPLRELLLNFNYLLFFYRNKGYLVNLGGDNKNNILSVLKSRGIGQFLNTKRIYFSELSVDTFCLSERDWSHLIPFLLDYSFRKELKRIHGSYVKFKSQSGVRRLFFTNEYVSIDSQLDLKFFLGAEYTFLKYKINNFALGLDYSPYLDSEEYNKQTSNFSYELLNPVAEKRFLKNNELIKKIFSNRNVIMSLGGLNFILPPLFLQIEGQIIEVEV